MAGPRKYFPGELEGNGVSKMVQVIRQLGFNNETQVDVGFITSLKPIEIRLQDGLVLEEDDFSLPERLTKHYEWHNNVKTAVDPRLKAGDAVIGILDEVGARFMVVDRISKSEADEWIEPEGDE